MKYILIFTFFISISSPVFSDTSLYDRGRAFFYGDGVEQDYKRPFLHLDKAQNLVILIL
jgi:hypothetical protein